MIFKSISNIFQNEDLSFKTNNQQSVWCCLVYPQPMIEDNNTVFPAVRWSLGAGIVLFVGKA